MLDHKRRAPESGKSLARAGGLGASFSSTGTALGPDAPPLAVFEVIALAGLCTRRPVPPRGHPCFTREEPRLRDEATSNSARWVRPDASTFLDGRKAQPELFEASDSVGLSEGVPRKPVGEDSEPDEGSEACNCVMGRLELEEERGPDFKTKRSRGRAP